MNFINYFKMYRLIEPEKGVFKKIFLIIITHLIIGNLYYNESGNVDFVVIIVMIGVLSVFIYTHSAEINQAQLIKQIPITSKRRFYYDLLAILYVLVLTILAFALFVILLNVILLISGYQYEITDSNPAFNLKNLYGIASYISYISMVSFSIQPLKYVTNNKKWYICYGWMTAGFVIYNIILGSVIEGSLKLRVNISEGVKNYEYAYLMVLFILMFTVITSVLFVKKSLSMAKTM
ncbi:MAG: hypothetical protein RBQ91_04015 [Acholeplasma sp.]|nr:hypothetical protein [Acholeplasma sp.]